MKELELTKKGARPGSEEGGKACDVYVFFLPFFLIINYECHEMSVMIRITSCICSAVERGRIRQQSLLPPLSILC